MPNRDKSLSKTLDKNYSFQAGIIFKLSQLNRKETSTAGGCPWVSFLMTWNKFMTSWQNTNCVRLGKRGRLQNSLKTGWNNSRWYPSHSVSVLEYLSLDTMIYEKSYCFVKALGWNEYGGSCVVNTSLASTFLDVLEQRYGEFVKIDFHIIWIDISLLW